MTSMFRSFYSFSSDMTRHEPQGLFLRIRSPAFSGPIQFWAAGRSCCDEAFNCGDARRGVKGGLVFLEERDRNSNEEIQG